MDRILENATKPIIFVKMPGNKINTMEAFFALNIRNGRVRICKDELISIKRITETIKAGEAMLIQPAFTTVHDVEKMFDKIDAYDFHGNQLSTYDLKPMDPNIVYDSLKVDRNEERKFFGSAEEDDDEENELEKQFMFGEPLEID